MKVRNYIIAAAALLMLAGCTCNQGKKVAVVYYSQTGNTKVVAEAIAKTLNDLTGPDGKALFNAKLVSIEPVKPYPDTFEATIEESREECMKNLGREIKDPVLKDYDKYDVIFIGYPVWFGTYAPPVKSFLEANNKLAGKTVVPFCTYGTGGRVNSASTLAYNCPDAKVIDSYGISDKRLDQVDDEVSFFISTIAGKLLKDCCKEGECKKDGECCKKDEGCCKKDEDCCGKHAEGETCTDGCCDKESWRELTEEDSAIFAAATENFDRMPLEPLRVKNVTLPGANRIYECITETRFGDKPKAEVYVLVPAGEGKPELTAVER
ncbi:MAG: NAD(P)H-dependent oxidoreductase [Bacteroidales bacterium]|nr:NAD(P)H-dependent oxidoreductase [Bacteroidales bacterium]